MSRILNNQKKILSPIQLKVMKFIKQFIGKFGYSPTAQEIGDGLNFTTPRTLAQYYINTLEKKGWIKCRPKHKYRNIKVVQNSGLIIKKPTK